MSRGKYALINYLFKTIIKKCCNRGDLQHFSRAIFSANIFFENGGRPNGRMGKQKP